MSGTRKVCVFTGTRAEYGLLRPLMREIERDRGLRLKVLASGMHLSPEFGLTVKNIEEDGFAVQEKVEMLTSSDSPVGILKSMGLGLIGYGEAMKRLEPDILVVLGDRFEAFCAAAAAMISRIPVAHLYGGEATHGLIDEPIRHCLTKMSHLHFTSTDEYRQRVIQLGEHPDRVFNVGALGIENIRELRLLSRKKLEKEIGFELGRRCLLVTFHPVTLENATAGEQFQWLLDALDSFPDIQVVFTKANADTDGRIINQMIDDYAAANPQKSVAFTSMGQLHYLSAMRYVAAVAGNSSSGIIEAPSLKVPTVNIGDRQKGRVRAESVIDCGPGREAVAAALGRALSPAFKKKVRAVKNPYEKQGTAPAVKKILKGFDLKDVLKKDFYDL